MKQKTVLNIFVLLAIGLVALAPMAQVSAATLAKKVSVDVQAGDAVQLVAGNCGFYGRSAPVDGEISLSNGVSASSDLRFAKGVCGVDYLDASGKTIYTAGAYFLKTINLTSQLRAQWDAGNLAFYTQTSSGWQVCQATLVDAGEYGRLACNSTSTGDFGLVDTRVRASEDEDEEAETASSAVPDGTPVSAGQSLDLASGNCGVYSPGLPATGYVDLGRESKSGLSGVAFVQNACSLDYTDDTGASLSSLNGTVIAYINLNKTQYYLWQAGDLAFYTGSDESWSECSAYYLGGYGEYGRLACRLSAPGVFGMVDTTVAAEEEVDS